MALALICFSHSPLMLVPLDVADKDAEQDWRDRLSNLDRWVRDYDPELIAVFYPDHFNGFFYRAMPSFCIATQAHGGIGYTWEYPLHIWLKRAVFDRMYLGASSVHRARSAALSGRTAATGG